MNLNEYKGKKVFITGHTGFKGSWMCEVLLSVGAEVYGYALKAPTNPSLYEILKLDNKIHSVEGDIRDLGKIQDVMLDIQPEIVIHMAAQPIVRESYDNPVYTYETNVMGTVNVLEAIRHCASVKTVINVTTDKVYKNNEWEWGYRENDALDGYDPYSNSKSCSELVTSSYVKSFFMDRDIAISTCRAGNVIGGGDFAKDRIIPDCVRAAAEHKEIVVRNPYSTRPYQHVLEPVCTYLYVALQQEKDRLLAGNYNVGPDDCDCVTTGELTELFCNIWGEGMKWKNVSQINAPHEANFLKLDCSKIKKRMSWKPGWHITDAIANTIEWHKAFLNNEDMEKVMVRQINDYLRK